LRRGISAAQTQRKLASVVRAMLKENSRT